MAGRFSASGGFAAPRSVCGFPSGTLAEWVDAAARRAHFSRASGVGDRPLIGRLDAAKAGSSPGFRPRRERIVSPSASVARSRKDAHVLRLLGSSDRGWSRRTPARAAYGDCPQCPLARAVEKGRIASQAHGVCQLGRAPFRPVLKHGPRSLTDTQVEGPYTKPLGAMKVEGGVGRPRWDPRPLGGAHHRPVSSALLGEAEEERVR